MARVDLSCAVVNAKMLTYLIWDVANQTFVNYQTSIRNSYVQFGIIVLSTENWFQSGSNGLEMFPQVFESGIFCLLTNWLTDPLTNPSTDWLIQSLNDWLMATSMKWQIAHISTSYLQVRSYIPFEYRRLYKIYQGKQKCTVNRNTHLLKNKTSTIFSYNEAAKSYWILPTCEETALITIANCIFISNTRLKININLSTMLP